MPVAPEARCAVVIGTTARSSSLESSEVAPDVAGADPDPLVTDRDPKGRVRSTAAARALAKMPRAPRSVPRKVLVHPDFKSSEHRRRDWLVKRRAELHTAHGGVSHGVGARLAMAAWLYSAAEFCAEQGARTLEPDWFRTAATLSATARTHDDSAWEMCAIEAMDRHKANGRRDPREALLKRIDAAGSK